MTKIAFIDDEYLVLKWLRITFPWEKYGIEVVGEAADGIKGLELIEQQRPDIVICDIKMPLLDGLELAKEVRNRGLNCKIIILSGFGYFEYAQEAIKYGVSDYLLKPIHYDKMVEAIEKVLNVLEKERIQREKFDSCCTASVNIPLTSSPEPDRDRGSVVEYGNKILQAVKMCDETYAWYLVDELFAQLQKNQKNAVSDCHSAAVEILVITLRCLYSVGMGKEEVFGKGFDPIDEIMGMQNVSEMKSLVRRTVGRVIGVIQSKKNRSYSRNVLDALKYIDEHMDRDVSVEEISERLHIGKGYFSTIFKREVGMSFVEYYTEKRMEKAKSLLVNGELKIHEIAEMVGYQDAKYFGQVFKRNVGKTPNEYRNELQKLKR